MFCIIILLILLLVVMITTICTDIVIEGGRRRKSGSKYTLTPSPVVKRAFLLFIKAQDINDYVIEAETPRDFWIVDFILSMANVQFEQGYSNMAKGFPLKPDRKLITKIYKEMDIWKDKPEEVLERKVDETIDIINKDYSTYDMTQQISKRVNITGHAVEIMRRMYPDNSLDSIIAYLLRYGSMYTYKDGEQHGRSLRDIHISKVFLSIPPPLYHFYDRNLSNCIESFASPLNRTLENRFCSIFDDDKDFGAIGPFTDGLVKSNKGSSFIVNPPYDTTTMNYVSNIIAENIDNNYAVCLPSKDGGLFHLYEGRILHPYGGEKEMKPSLDTLLRISTLSGILIIPAKCMFYWNFFKQRKERINYDTIFLYYLKDKDINVIEFMTKVQKIILKFAFGDNYGNQKQIHQIQEEKIMEMYPMNGSKIIESLKIKF